jgi:septal ring factor EnvC (AmiA/AmiB activator)
MIPAIKSMTATCVNCENRISLSTELLRLQDENAKLRNMLMKNAGLMQQMLERHAMETSKMRNALYSIESMSPDQAEYEAASIAAEALGVKR